MLRKIQSASEKTQATDSVRWYTIPTDTAMPKADVTYNTIGFEGNVGSGATFTLYLDNAKTGSKTYHVYFKQLAGSGKLTLTTGKAGATNLVLSVGTYVAIIYVDENGNITTQGATATTSIQTGNTQPAESGAVADALSEKQDTLTFDNFPTKNSNNPVKSNGIYASKMFGNISRNIASEGWYKVYSGGHRNGGASLTLSLASVYLYHENCSHIIQITSGYNKVNIQEIAKDVAGVFDKIRICYGSTNNDPVVILLHYTKNQQNPSYLNIYGETGFDTSSLFNFEADSTEYYTVKEFNLGTDGIYYNGNQIDPTDTVTSGSSRAITSGAIYEALQNIGNLTIKKIGNEFATTGKNSLIENENFNDWDLILFRIGMYDNFNIINVYIFNSILQNDFGILTENQLSQKYTAYQQSGTSTSCRVIFGPIDNTSYRITNRVGVSNHLPRIVDVYGIKF